MPSYGASFQRAFAVLIGLAFTSCFESPVREGLLLRFLPNGAVVATSTVEIADSGQTNPALARRLAETRRAILEGTDDWGARFAAAGPAAERFSWEKRLGDLRIASRSAVIAEPEGLETIFRDTSLGVIYTIDAERGVAELTLTPGPSVRATRRQREEMKRTLEAWSAAIAEYLQAGGDLYTYLEGHPDRARTCFGALFAESKDEREDGEELTADEKGKVERLDEAIQKVVEVLLVPEGEDHSPDEVSHLIYDPFPARLTVKLPGRPLSMEGFIPGTDGSLTVLTPGLWEALKSLEGRWLSPEPVLFYVASARKGGKEPDLDAFLRRARKASSDLPMDREVRAAIEERLRPAPFYRVSWQVRPDDETEFHWEEGEKSP